NDKIGILMVVANTRLTTKNLNGLVPDTSIASICSVTFMEPNSAPIWEPTLPEAMSAVTNGARARIIAMDINAGNHEVAPNSANDGRDWLVNTIPVIKPVNEIRGNDFHPTSKHCRMISLNS